MRSYECAALSLGAMLLSSGPASANPAVSAVAVSNAPIQVTKCSSDGNRRYTNVFNRTSESLKSFTERWIAYASGGKKVGAEDLEFDIDSLASGDSGGYDQNVPTAAFTTGSGTVARFTCTIVAADFGDGTHWSSGKTWHGDLLPLVAATNGRGTGSSNESNGRLKFAVIKSWNDFSPGQYVVHDTLMITGAAGPTTISADRFVLNVTLANGGMQQFVGLTKAAPTYSKFNYFTKTNADVGEVNPSEDLGALGSLIVPPHGTVIVTVSFIISAPLADPDANRNVTMP
jgi:hypothetical protein